MTQPLLISVICLAFAQGAAGLETTAFAADIGIAALNHLNQVPAELGLYWLADLARLDDAAFRTLFRKSPVKRTGRDRFVRNVVIALGNSGDAAQVPVVEERLTDTAPLVRGAAVWALSRLAPGAVPGWRARLLPQEPDADVRDEWGQAA